MGLLSSPRRRRRLRWVALAIAIAAPLIALGVHFSNPGNPRNATGPDVNVPGYAQPKKAPFTQERRREVTRVVRQFILTAVNRQDVGRSWEITAPSMREGFTRRQWKRGDLPVVPYPAIDRGLGQGYVEYSYTDSVGLEVYLFPKPGSGYSQLTADVELVRGKDGRWLVDYWMPKKFHGPPALTAEAKAKAKRQAAKAQAAAKRSRRATRQQAAAAPPPPPEAYVPPKHSDLYWIVPLAVLGGLALLPIGFGARAWRQNRRARREWQRS